MSKNRTPRKEHRSIRTKETTISTPPAVDAQDFHSDPDDHLEAGRSVAVIAPISPVSVSANYEELSLAEIKLNIERITRGARIGTPFWGVGGRLWIPLRDVGLEEEFRQELRAHGFTVYEGTKKIGKLSRSNQVGFIVCMPPGKTATLAGNAREKTIPSTQQKGIKRALLVEKIRREIVEICNILELEEDYETKIRTNAALRAYKVIAVCNRHPDLREKLCAVKQTKKPKFVELASEIASRSTSNRQSKPIGWRTFQDAHKRYGAKARALLKRA